jgi:glycerol kinase
MDNRYYWIIDIGSSSVRAFAVYQDGRMQQCASHALVTRLHEDSAEYDGHVLRNILQDIAQTLPAGTPIAAGLACQRSTVIMWDQQSGEPLHAALSWADRRAAAWMQSISMDAPWLHEVTGLRWAPYYGIGKLRWLLQHVAGTQVSTQAMGLGPLVSYAVQQLTGHYYLDESIAARTLMWNVSQRQWEARLCALADIPINLLPSVKPTCAEYGDVHTVEHRIPLQLVIADQSAALHAVDLPDDAVFINIGTGAFIFCHAPQQASVDTSLLSSLIHSNAEQQVFALEATVNGAAAALQWAAHTLHLSTAQLAWCTEQFVNIAEPPIFINTVGGLGSPWWQAGDEAHWLDAETISTEAKIAGVIESIVFLIAHNIERMARAVSLREIYLSGGLANINGFAQCLADVSDLPVRTTAQTEATVYGAARLLAHSLTHLPVLAPITLSAVLLPHAESTHRIALLGRYQLFLKHLPLSELA